MNPKYDWYQNNTHVFISFKVENDKELSKNTNISFENQKVTLTANSQTIEVPLSNEIIGE
ncbi:MAG: CS domain-containing protein, partial [bacterium]